ncbi:MAG: HAMP domain-containing sensor histidine kinase [Woeseiaceae bacterium]|nr:HAMP domain-containing sensor histidine kinase [Woeseiaceae bacterium]
MTRIEQSLRAGGELSTGQIVTICAALGLAIVASVLTIVGFLVPEPSSVPWIVVVNRLLALSAIWLTVLGATWLILTRRRSNAVTLREAQREADRARAAKLRFLQTVSNDIRHHLQTLVLLNGALIRTVDDAKAQKMFAGQGDALAHLSDLMNSLLDITDIETGEVTPTIEEFQLEDVLIKLNKEFRDKARAKQIELEIVQAKALVRTDRELLTKMLRSLVSNGIRYTEKGQVTVDCQPVTGGLRITVQDTGIGIADDHLADIFDEFYRIDNDPTARDNGLGLGLTIVDRISRLLDIKLNVTSQVGGGSMFTLLVPVVARPL